MKVLPVRELLGQFITVERRAVAASFVRFATVGTTGLVVDTAVLYAVKGVLGLYWAAVPSYLVSATWTWWLNRSWTFRGQGSGPLWRQWLRFLGVNLLGLVCNRSTYFALVTASATCRAYPVLALAAGAVAGLFANFFMSRRLVFR